MKDELLKALEKRAAQTDNAKLKDSINKKIEILKEDKSIVK